MLKAELIKILEKLFTLSGNHDVTRLLELRDEFLNFLREEKQLFMDHDDVNIMNTMDAIHFIDALNIYASTTNRAEASTYVQPLFRRLLETEEWNYYELRFLIGALSYTVDVNQALSLADKAIEILMNFRADNRFKLLSGLVAYHTLSRILYAKFFEDNHNVNLENLFEQWFSKLKWQLLDEPKLKVHFNVAEVKCAIFVKDSPKVSLLMQEFENNYDEKIVKAISNEINSYIASKGYSLQYSKAM